MLLFGAIDPASIPTGPGLGMTHWPLTTTFSIQPMKNGNPWAKMRKNDVAPPRTVIPKLVSVELMDSTGFIGYMASY
jgi:hypothetical protein